MPKITKGHNSLSIFFFQNLFRSSLGHLLITTNPFTKFQGSSSSIFFRYFADKVKMPKITKGHNSRSIFQIYSKVNQVVYSSLPVYSPSFTTLALTVFYIYFADKVKMPKISKGHNSRSIFQNLLKY